jgi:hypothetical protein
MTFSTLNTSAAAGSITEVTRAPGGSTYIPNTFTYSPACVANYKGIADANAITYAGAYAIAYADADTFVKVRYVHNSMTRFNINT